jgi:hypothetical protein
MIPDPQAGANLLQRMTGDAPKDMTFSDAQVGALIEVFIKRFVTDAPGMAGAGLSCDIKRVDNGWDIEIRKPQ